MKHSPTADRSVPVGRLAPSPTGVLHLGNARSFMLAWLSVRSRGGTVLMRIEDIDGPRTRPGAEQMALDDLRWLGLDWDGESVRQSDRLKLYDEAARKLLEGRQAYACVCTRKEVETAASAPHEDWHDATPYPGTCRDRFASVDAARQATGREPALRFRVATDAVGFDDLVRGPTPGLVAGDFVIHKRAGGPAYQLAVAVDDAATGVTEVLRGDDLLASTPRQLLLYDALGLPAPRFAHVPLVVGPDGRRLAKRHGDTSLRCFREQGVTPDRIVGYLAHTCGLVPAGTRCMPDALLDGFALQAVPRQPVVWNGDFMA